MRIAIGGDRAGEGLAGLIATHLRATTPHTVVDMSHPDDDHPELYSELSERVGLAITRGDFDRGILCCGTGIGVCISANKIPGIRAALTHDTYSAERAALSNDAQIITMGARVIGPELAKSIVAAWLAHSFDPAGPSAGNVAGIEELSRKYSEHHLQTSHCRKNSARYRPNAGTNGLPGKTTNMKKALLLGAVLAATPLVAQAADNSTPLRFVLIPKVVHPWFDKLNTGARAAADMITKTTGQKIEIEYRAPQTADVSSQNDIIERAIATHPDGLILDLLDEKGNRATMDEATEQKIPMTVFDSLPPEGMNITAVGADFCEQGTIAAERLATLIGKKGEVAIMMGVPTAPNHTLRAECEKKVFAKYPDIKVVATGIDNDSIETGQKQASAIMQAHPNLVGWVACDASGPVGIGQAIRESGKAGKVQEVGLDNLNDMLQLIRDGVAESTASSRPEMQGYWAVVSAWQSAMGQKTPKYIDTGIDVITKKSL